MVRADRFDATREEARARAKIFSPGRSRLSTAGRKGSCLPIVNRSKENSGGEGIEETWSVVWSG